MQNLTYTSRGLRRRRNSDRWEAVLSHTDPVTGEVVRTFHTVEGKTRRQAERARDALILELERKGGAVGSSMSVRELMEQFLVYKEGSGTIEPSTVRGYRAEARQIDSYIGNVRLADLSVEDVSGWMRDMSADGYAPKSVSKPFRLLKQALKWGMAQDLITKNPCDFCKPPKRVKTPINALPREERTRMLELARRAQPAPLVKTSRADCSEAGAPHAHPRPGMHRTENLPRRGYLILPEDKPRGCDGRGEGSPLAQAQQAPGVFPHPRTGGREDGSHL